MIIFVFIGLGLLLGEHLARRGDQERRCTVLGAIAASAVLGVGLWLAGLNGDVVLGIAETVVRPLPRAAATVLLAVVVLVYLALLVGGAVIAATLTVVAFAAALHRARRAAPHHALPAVEAYAGAVAAAVHEITGTQVDVVVTDEHTDDPADLWMDLNTAGINARWTATHGWSARTLTGRRWYPQRLAPSPGAIALWLVEVRRRPRLGSPEIPTFDSTVDLKATLLATIPPPSNDADVVRGDAWRGQA